MAMLSRDEFDAIEFSAARTGEHREAALRMSRLAAACSPTRDMSRAEAYLRAGEQWLLADDPSAAADGFRRAMTAGGSTSADPRVSLARALFLLDRADEAMRLIRQLESATRRDPRLCDLVAELLVEQADLSGALEWATAGVELCLADARTGQPGPPAGPSLVPKPQPAEGGQTAPGGPGGQGTAGGAGGQAAAGGAGSRGAVRRLASVPRQAPPAVDRTELRMLLSLRYRIRNDLGLPEDRYDKLLDEL